MIRPAGHRVLVKVQEAETVTAAGIIIPDAISERQAEANVFGEIVAVGPTAWRAFDDGQPWAKVGDLVAFAKYGGFVIVDPDTKERFRLLNDEDVTAVIERG